NQPRASRPAPAAKHLVVPKPWNRIFLIRIYYESWIGSEIIGCPFPNISDHLAASELAVARRQGAGRYAAHCLPIKIRSLRRGRLLSPGELRLPSTASRAAGGLPVAARRRHFPLRLTRQSSPSPSTKCIGLIPAHMNDRQLFFERCPVVEVSPAPSAAIAALPVDRMIGLHLSPPAPPRPAPIALAQIPAGFNELCKLPVAHGGPRNLEPRDIYRMRPFLVIEYKRLGRRCSNVKAPAGHFSIAQEPPGVRAACRKRHTERRSRISESLPGIGYCFRMHVLMVKRQQVKILVFLGQNLTQSPPFNAIDHRLEDLPHISKRLVTSRQRQVPSRVVGDGRRIIQLVSTADNRISLSQMAQCPFLLEPRHMSNLPQRRVDDVEMRPEHFLVRKIRNKLERTRPSLCQCTYYLIRKHNSSFPVFASYFGQSDRLRRLPSCESLTHLAPAFPPLPSAPPP